MLNKSTALMIVATLALLSGCASTSPVNGILYADVKGPVAVTNIPKGAVKGEACATSYLGMIATGDASITAAAAQGGITSIAHVDQHSTNIVFGIISTYCTEVYGHKGQRGTASVRPATPAPIR